MPYSDLVTKIVSQYLYGQASKPTDIASNDLIRTLASTSFQVPFDEYMAGAGRFAKASMSSLVDQFFRPQAHPTLESLAPGRYSKSQLAALFDNDSYGIAFSQWQYTDDTDDVAERAFLWNSTSLKLADDVELAGSTTCTSCRVPTQSRISTS